MQKEPKDCIGQSQKHKFKQIVEMRQNGQHRFHCYLQKLEHNGIHITHILTNPNEVFKYEQTSSCSYLKDYQQYQIQLSYFSLTLQTYQINLPLQVNNQLEQYLFQFNGRNYQLFPCNSLNKNNILFKATLHKILRILLQQQSISISRQDKQKDVGTELKTNNYKIGKDKRTFDLIWDTSNYNIWLPAAKTNIFFDHAQSDQPNFCQLQQIKLAGPQGKSISQLAQFLSVIQATSQICYQCIGNQVQKQDSNKEQGTLYITMALHNNCIGDNELNCLYENMLNPANFIIETRNNKIGYYVAGKIVQNMEQPPLFTQISAMFDLLAQFYLSLNYQSVTQLYDAKFAHVAKNNHILLRNLLCTLYYNLDKPTYQAYRNNMLKAWQQKPEQMRQKQTQTVKAQWKMSTKQKSGKPSNNLGIKHASEGEKSISIKKINEIIYQSEQSYGGSSCQQIFNQDNNFDDFSADQQIEGNLVTIDKKRKENAKAEFEIGVEYQFLFKDSKNGKMIKQIQQRSKMKKSDSEIKRIKKPEQRSQKQRPQLKEAVKEDGQDSNEDEEVNKAKDNSLGKKGDENSVYELDKKQLFKQIRGSKQKLWKISNSLWLIGKILLNEDAVRVFQFIKYLLANFGNYYHASTPKWMFSSQFVNSFVIAVLRQIQQSLGMGTSSGQLNQLEDEQLQVAWLYLNYAILVYIRYDMQAHEPDWQRITAIKQNLQKQTTLKQQNKHTAQEPGSEQGSSNEGWRRRWIYCLSMINKNISYKLECLYRQVRNRDETLTTLIQLLDTNIKYMNVMVDKQIANQNIGQIYYFIAAFHAYSSLAAFFQFAKVRDLYVQVFDFEIPKIIAQSMRYLNSNTQNQHDNMFAQNIVQFRAILAHYIDQSLFMGQYYRQSKPKKIKAITSYAIISKLSQGWMFKLQNPQLAHPHWYHCPQHIKLLGQILHHKEYVTYSSLLREIREQRTKVGEQASQQYIQKILDSLKQKQKRIKASMKMKMKTKIKQKQQKYSIFHQHQYFIMLYLISYLSATINATPILYEYRAEIEDIFIELAQIGRQSREPQRITALMIIFRDGRRGQRMDDVYQLIYLLANQLLLAIQSAAQQLSTRWPNFNEQGPKLEQMFKQIQTMKNLNLTQLNQLRELLQTHSKQKQKMSMFLKLRIQFSQLSQFHQYFIYYGRNMKKSEQYGERQLKLLSNFPLNMAKYEENNIKYLMRTFYPHNMVFRAKTPLIILQQLYQNRMGTRSVTLVGQYIQALYCAEDVRWIDVLEEAYCQSIVSRKNYQHVWVSYVEFLPTLYPRRVMTNYVNTFAKFDYFQLTHSLTKNKASFFIYMLGIEYLRTKKTDLNNFDVHFTFLKWLCIAFGQSKHLLTVYKRKTISAVLHSITAQVYRLKNHRKSKLHYKKLQKFLKSSQLFIFRASFLQNTNTYHKIHRLYQKHSEYINNLGNKKLYKLLCAKCCENCYNQTYPKIILTRMLEKVRRYQRIGHLDRTV